MSGSVSAPIPANWRVPLFYARFDPSNANPGQTPQRTLVIGQAANGITVPNSVQPIGSATQAAGIYGPQSPAARMVADTLANDPDAALYVWAPPAAAGSAPAIVSITIAGTATAAGALMIYIGGDLVAVPVLAGQSASTIATNAAAAVNAKPSVCMSAAAAGTSVTLTAEFAGAAGNQIDVRLNYLGLAGGEQTPFGLTVTISTASGGLNDPDLTVLDGIIGDQNFDFIFNPYSQTPATTAMSQTLNNVSGRWSVTRGSYGHAFGARSDSYANLLALGGSLNDPHTTIPGVQGSPIPPWRLAAMFGGIAAGSLKDLASRPLQRLPLIGMLAPSPADRFTKAQINNLLNTGIACIDYGSDGTASIVRAVTTYQQNLYGQPDQSYLDTETPFTLMQITREANIRFTSKYPRALLVPDGTHLGPGVPVITPNLALAELYALYEEQEYRGLVDNADAMKRATSAEISRTDPSRLEIYWSPNLASGCRIIDMVNRFSLLAPTA